MLAGSPTLEDGASAELSEYTAGDIRTLTGGSRRRLEHSRSDIGAMGHYADATSKARAFGSPTLTGSAPHPQSADYCASRLRAAAGICD